MGDSSVIDDAVAALRRGEVVVVPTDTVYGVAALLPFAGRLFEVKRRPRDVDLPVLVASAAQLVGLVALPLPAVAEALIDRWWPGGLTLVLDRDPQLSAELGRSATTIGVRCPASPVVHELCARVGPLAATSANRHGAPTPTTAAEVASVFGDEVAVVIDGGECDGAPSTVVRVDRSGAVTVLRPGVVSGEGLSLGPSPEPQE